MAATETWQDELDEARAAREAESEPIPGQQDGEVDVHEPPVGDIVIAGTTQLGLFNAGGKKPTTATLTIRGKTVDLASGQALKKGDRIEVTGVIVIDDVGQKDKRDKATGMVTDCGQRHSGFWEDLTVDALTG